MCIRDSLNILALYRTEVTNLALAEQQNQPDRVEAMMRFGQAQIAVDEMTAQTLLTEGLMAPDLLRLYREDPTRRSARIKAALKGALRGAAIGAGVGLISDLVSMYLSHARAEDAAQKAYDQFMQRGAGRVDYINRDVVPLPAEAQLPSEFASQDWLGVHGFNVIPTDYGNALKHAIYANGIRPEGMNISEEQYQGFLQLLNYVKPEQFQNINVPLGEGAYHFDTQILQNWVTHVFQDPQGIDFQHIAHADSFIGQVTEGVAQKFAGAAAAAAAPEVFGEMAAHGVAVGAGAGLAGLPGPRKTEEATVSGVSAAPRAETGEQRQARVRDEAMEDYHQILSGREKEIDQQLLPLYEEARERVKEKGNYVFELDEIKRVLNEAEGKPEDERHDHLAHVIWIKKGRKENDLTKEADSRHADELLEIMARIREKRAQIEAELDRQANEIKAKLAPENPDDVIWLKTDLPSGDLRAKMRKLSELTSSGRWKIIWTQEAVDETPELSGDFYLTAVHPDVGDEGKLFYSQDSEAVYSPDQTSIGGRMLSKIKELKKME